ncbi:hypothetical protein [Trinickia mobilis]|uniref:hypothetical protein n=1 Tax=Trinickia mobilis TaxID=2816356 RepID=UPI001F5D072F|nr:hypothetical protein [Trinickia mobilis]
MRIRELNIDAKRELESVESIEINPIIPIKIKWLLLGTRPNVMNRETKKIKGVKSETIKAYPEYFLIRGMENCLAISTMDSISVRERPLSSGMIHVSTNLNWIVMAVEIQSRVLRYAVTDGPIPGHADGRVQ